MSVITEERVEISEELRIGYGLAADYLREHGWCQGAMVDEQGHVCLIGAIDGAAHGQIALYRMLVTTLYKHLGRSGFYWNDEPGRTEEEVLALLDELSCG